MPLKIKQTKEQQKKVQGNPGLGISNKRHEYIKQVILPTLVDELKNGFVYIDHVAHVFGYVEGSPSFADLTFYIKIPYSTQK